MDPNAPAVSRRVELLLLAVLIAAGVALQLWVFAHVPFDVDELDKLRLGSHYGRGWRPLRDMVVVKPVIFAFLNSQLIALFGPESLWPYRVPYMLVGALDLVALHLLVRRLAGARAGLVATALLGLSNTWVVTTLQVRADGLLVLCILLSFWVLLSWERVGGRWRLGVAGLLLGFATVLKLMPLPIAGLVGLWLLLRERNRQGLGDAAVYALGLGAPVFLLGLNYPFSPLEALFKVPSTIFWVWGVMQLSLSTPGARGVAFPLLRQPLLYFVLSAAVLWWFAQVWRREQRRGMVRIIALSLLVYLPMLAFKRESYVQDLLLATTLGALLAGWISARAPRQLLVGLTLLVALEAPAAISRYVDVYSAELAHNPHVLQAHVRRCAGGDAMDFATFERCFATDIKREEDVIRLTQAQQVAAMRFFNAVAGSEGVALSGSELNVFTRGSPHMNPPPLTWWFHALQGFYGYMAAGTVPQGLLSSIEGFTRRGHGCVFCPAEDGLGGNLFRELGERAPPVVLNLDYFTLSLYGLSPQLQQRLAERYVIWFHAPAASFFAIERRRFEALKLAAIPPEPHPAEALYQSALEAHATGDPHRAIAELSEACEQAHFTDHDAVIQLAEWLYEDGQTRSARRALRALDSDSRRGFRCDPASLDALGRWFTRDGKALERRYRALIDRDPAAPASSHCAAMVKAQLGHRAEAAADFARLSDPIGRVTHAELLLELEAHAEAARRFAALAFTPMPNADLRARLLRGHATAALALGDRSLARRKFQALLGMGDALPADHWTREDARRFLGESR